MNDSTQRKWLMLLINHSHTHEGHLNTLFVWVLWCMACTAQHTAICTRKLSIQESMQQKKNLCCNRIKVILCRRNDMKNVFFFRCFSVSYDHMEKKALSTPEAKTMCQFNNRIKKKKLYSETRCNEMIQMYIGIKVQTWPKYDEKMFRLRMINKSNCDRKRWNQMIEREIKADINNNTNAGACAIHSEIVYNDEIRLISFLLFNF